MRYGRPKEHNSNTLRILEPDESWNLFWLSEPLAEDEEQSVFSPVLWASHEVTASDETLSKILTTLRPVDAVAAIKLLDYKSIQHYKILGDAWIVTMEHRAKSARGIAEVYDNVISVNFGGSVFNLQKGISSAMIMPMSFNKQ